MLRKKHLRLGYSRPGTGNCHLWQNCHLFWLRFVSAANSKHLLIFGRGVLHGTFPVISPQWLSIFETFLDRLRQRTCQKLVWFGLLWRFVVMKFFQKKWKCFDQICGWLLCVALSCCLLQGSGQLPWYGDLFPHPWCTKNSLSCLGNKWSAGFFGVEKSVIQLPFSVLQGAALYSAARETQICFPG